MRKDAVMAARAFTNLFSGDENHKIFDGDVKPEHDEDIIFNHLRFAEMIHPDGGIMLCPISHARSKYVGINCERIFGHSHASLLNMSLADFFELIHPDDILPVQQCLNFINQFKPFDPGTHRFVMRYRIRNSEGEYHYIQDEKLAISTSASAYLFLLLYSNVPTEVKYYHVAMDIFKQVNGKFIKVYTYNPKQKEQGITPRQQDIAKLILRGLSNQQIADHLSVSVFTVKNHKKMLFKKINVRNSVDFANYVRQTAG